MLGVSDAMEQDNVEEHCIYTSHNIIEEVNIILAGNKFIFYIKYLNYTTANTTGLLIVGGLYALKCLVNACTDFWTYTLLHEYTHDMDKLESYNLILKFINVKFETAFGLTSFTNFAPITFFDLPRTKIIRVPILWLQLIV